MNHGWRLFYIPSLIYQFYINVLSFRIICAFQVNALESFELQVLVKKIKHQKNFLLLDKQNDVVHEWRIEILK